MSVKPEECVSIDFGTTNSLIYIYKRNECLAVPSGVYGKEGSNLFPSFVEYSNQEAIVGRQAMDTYNKCNRNVGISAKANSGKQNKYVVCAVKRILGLTFAQYQQLNDKDVFGCKVVEENGYPCFVINKDGSTVKPIEVASEIFKVLKKRADEFGNQDYKSAYVTVPANFKDHQCRAIRDAARLAGLNVEMLIKEPTAAAMSWCFDHMKEIRPNERIIVYDFGGGTFDVSHVQYRINEGFSVVDTDGDTLLGGNDVDKAIMDFIFTSYTIQSGEDLRERMNRIKLRKLRNECEERKILLSNSDNAQSEEINIMDYCPDIDMPISLTHQLLDQAISAIVEKTLTITQRLLEKNRINVGNIKYVILVGGSSYLHLVRQKMKEKFFTSTFPYLEKGVSSFIGFEAVALGAMKRKINDYYQHVKITERVVVSYGLLSSENEVAIVLPKGHPIPALSNAVDFTNTEEYADKVYTHVYQWNGEPSTLPTKKGVYIAPVEECTEIDSLSFAIPSGMRKPKGEQKMSVEFYLPSSGTIEVICKNAEPREVLKIVEYSPLTPFFTLCSNKHH